MKKASGKANPLVSDLVGFLSRKAPFDLAEEWDNVGLLAGDPADAVRGVVTAVNLGPEALEAAEKTGANVVVCHHPPIFKPAYRLTKASHPYLFDAIRKGISVIALHTNFDLSSEEVTARIAGGLKLKAYDFLSPRQGSETSQSLKLGKFVTFVPETALDGLREALWSVGAGKIGAYGKCSFSVQGEGTFQGDEGTHPTVGVPGRLEKAPERRVETVFPWKIRDKVVEAARKAHPYEEMAYDVYELSQPAKKVGYGFVARPEIDSTKLVFHNFIEGVKEQFNLRSLVVAGPGLSNPGMKVEKVAFSPGSGSGFIGAAVAKGIDVYICGELGYHQILEARQKGLTVAILGHSYSERFFVEVVSGWCEGALAETNPLPSISKVFEAVHEVL